MVQKAVCKIFVFCIFLLLQTGLEAQCMASITSSNNTSGNVSFIATVPGSVTGSSFQWGFGDGSNGNGLVTNHTYTADGIYVVSFTITAPGTCTNVVFHTVSVNNASTCVLTANYTYSASNAGVVAFTAVCTGTHPGSSYAWDFGDQTSAGTGALVTHTYSKPGNYSVSLFVANNLNCFTTYSNVVTVKSATCNLDALFGHTMGPGGVVTFTNLSQGLSASTNHLWEFGDGVISSDLNPKHTYSNAGTHYVRLSLIEGTCTDTISKALNITGVSCKANSEFSLQPTTVPTLWLLSPTYPYNVISTLWDWGDGSTSTNLYASHQYAVPGAYTICLSVVVSCDSASTTCHFFPEKQIHTINVVKPQLTTGVQPREESPAVQLLYPNPGEGLVHVKLPQISNEALFIVYNAEGRIIFEENLFTDDDWVFTLNLEGAPAGLYVLRAASAGGILTSKFQIRR